MTVQSSPTAFADRHIGARRQADIDTMLKAIGYDSVDGLVDVAVPDSIRQSSPLTLQKALSETQVLAELRKLAAKNKTAVQMIGQGYYDTITPPVIRRNILESPAWYTAYTPYQPEISQGRLEALLNFQTMVQDLTGLPIANASLLDEATAVAEAVLLMRRANKDKTAKDGKTVLDADLFPQTIAIVKGRAEALGFEVEVADLSAGLPDGDINGVVLQQPGVSGRVFNHAPVIASAKERGALVTVAADLLALTLITPPGEQGADIAVGTAQRFGVPLFFGGPHAAYMAVRQGMERTLPGRIVGVSKDNAGVPAYRLALQTREQHIRREKATSNICTAQALLAIVASMYAVYHGPDGLKAIAETVHGHARVLATALQKAGRELVSDSFFDTLTVRVPGKASKVIGAAEARGINLRRIDEDTVGVSVDETTTPEVLSAVAVAFGAGPVGDAAGFELASDVLRTSDFLQHPVFSTHRSETQLLRYIRKLSDRDLALDRTMIPLGSCTMKLNATAEMEAISWPEFASIHPFAPDSQTEGWRELISGLEADLTEITGYDQVSIQPNAGSQGELAGLLAIRGYHHSRGDQQRNVCLIPASAHGTNAASAVLAGMKVVVVATASDGTIDHEDLKAKIEANRDVLSAIMITYPSTHGVYDADVVEVCEAVHEAGGQVYVDGANLNALVGLAQPGKFGGDVSHLNLHKTFCIPHGGGGPGVGPVAAKAHLAPFMPGDANKAAHEEGHGVAISASRFGSAGVLPISWAYVKLMGGEGLTEATKSALLAANYVASRLNEHFPVLYTGEGGLVAHECILDLRELTARTGVTAEDVAKRLIDFGFHAPTLAFPVAGTLMVEPTESEDLAEIDRFIEAMITIRAEIEQVASGDFSVEDSPLRNAPHTAAAVVSSSWERNYPREQAVFPVPSLKQDKYFPPVGRIDGAAGDRNLVCSCPPLEAFEENTAELAN
ncbi:MULTISPECIES: aminomethyl-transferring glycine dehydrogenase [Paenarthrobacter]|uniref:Glycine dehydrogenase (decarboxylating) n=2 Tax=Paenarthrobacter TaxID=1742992 RepID=A0AAX3EHV5_PAEUR|nr:MULTISPECIES: aminomethyl-transferring glycine dehydrogenase [Paenarthrobacter]NKR13468.1 glycine dehydrogenase (aminomethyl-transferring) [Arthrobacter sp. M5]NKR17313.1 glycine dehydrogenase (aminomethyl-transferring) [Arthrobacter sp. M6]OEH58210.1 glycine dehydrogenase (aminomethyl-transferring) [Arthrobacter sp. D2]MDO5866629.1 aminomethyl-transferring glycine dehydrogenase [Paenarthrobacter sp. SD-2]MDO5877729.1 aminomethyl-transferring glycine dehydrogenase [Paenarthrobacter sp. SD-1